jgi:hypothetical protein
MTVASATRHSSRLPPNLPSPMSFPSASQYSEGESIGAGSSPACPRKKTYRLTNLKSAYFHSESMGMDHELGPGETCQVYQQLKMVFSETQICPRLNSNRAAAQPCRQGWTGARVLRAEEFGRLAEGPASLCRHVTLLARGHVRVRIAAALSRVGMRHR